MVAGPQADNAPNTLGNYDCGYNAEIWHNPGYEGCVNNHTSVVGGLRNGGTGLTGGEVVYEPGCLSSDCTESDFGKLASVGYCVSLHTRDRRCGLVWHPTLISN